MTPAERDLLILLARNFLRPEDVGRDALELRVRINALIDAIKRDA